MYFFVKIFILKEHLYVKNICMSIEAKYVVPIIEIK